jgi:hypothetical protein
MFLATHTGNSLKDVVCTGKHLIHRSSMLDKSVMREERTLFNSFFDGENLREIFVFDEDCTSTCASTSFAICDDKTDGLAGSEYFIDCKEDFYLSV